MPRLRYVNGVMVEEPLHHELPSTRQAPPAFSGLVALPEDGWSSGADARRRRGISGAGKALRDQVRRAGGADPGADACEARVRLAVSETERQRG